MRKIYTAFAKEFKVDETKSFRCIVEYVPVEILAKDLNVGTKQAKKLLTNPTLLVVAQIDVLSKFMNMAPADLAWRIVKENLTSRI